LLPSFGRTEIELPIRWQRDAGIDDLRLPEDYAVFLNGDGVNDPERGRVREERRELFKVEVTGAALLGEFHVSHRFERNTDEELELGPGRLYQDPRRDVGRDIVRGKGDGESEVERESQVVYHI
jgi:hypothetical protein